MPYSFKKAIIYGEMLRTHIATTRNDNFNERIENLFEELKCANFSTKIIAKVQHKFQSSHQR